MPEVWVQLSEMAATAPLNVRVEAKAEFVVAAREIFNTSPVILGVVMAVE